MKGEIVRSAREPRTLLGTGPAFYVKRGGREALPAPPPVPSAAVPNAGEPRRESVVSAEFFQEGERQEALGWKDSPLVDDATSSEAPVEFSSFDRVPKRRGPLVITTAVVAIAVLAGLGAEALRGSSSHAWVAAHAGPRAAHAWGRARSEWVTLKARGAALTGGKPASAAAPAIFSAGTAATGTAGNFTQPPVDAPPETATHDQSTAFPGVGVTDEVRVASNGPTAANPRDRPRASPVATARLASPRRRGVGSLRAGELAPRRPLSSWAEAELAMAPTGGPAAPPPDARPASPQGFPSAAEPPGEGAAAGAATVPIPASPAPETAPPPFEAPAPEAPAPESAAAP